MNIRVYVPSDEEDMVRLIAGLRATLDGFKDTLARTDHEAARSELNDFLRHHYHILVADSDDPGLVGFIVCRSVDDVTWAESIYVQESYRRSGVGTALFAKAEEFARVRGQDTLYTWVHPNNDGIIGFLKARGYDVLNLIEVRKPHNEEAPGQKVDVLSHEFRY